MQTRGSVDALRACIEMRLGYSLSASAAASVGSSGIAGICLPSSSSNVLAQGASGAGASGAGAAGDGDAGCGALGAAHAAAAAALAGAVPGDVAGGVGCPQQPAAEIEQPRAPGLEDVVKALRQDVEKTSGCVEAVQVSLASVEQEICKLGCEVQHLQRSLSHFVKESHSRSETCATNDAVVTGVPASLMISADSMSTSPLDADTTIYCHPRAAARSSGDGGTLLGTLDSQRTLSPHRLDTGVPTPTGGAPTLPLAMPGMESPILPVACHSPISLGLAGEGSSAFVVGADRGPTRMRSAPPKLSHQPLCAGGNVQVASSASMAAASALGASCAGSSATQAAATQQQHPWIWQALTAAPVAAAAARAVATGSSGASTAPVPAPVVPAPRWIHPPSQTAHPGPVSPSGGAHGVVLEGSQSESPPLRRVRSHSTVAAQAQQQQGQATPQQPHPPWQQQVRVGSGGGQGHTARAHSFLPRAVGPTVPAAAAVAPAVAGGGSAGVSGSMPPGGVGPNAAAGSAGPRCCSSGGKIAATAASRCSTPTAFPSTPSATPLPTPFRTRNPPAYLPVAQQSRPPFGAPAAERQGRASAPPRAAQQIPRPAPRSGAGTPTPPPVPQRMGQATPQAMPTQRRGVAHGATPPSNSHTPLQGCWATRPTPRGVAAAAAAAPPHALAATPSAAAIAGFNEIRA